jgi:hypothetical protein
MARSTSFVGREAQLDELCDHWRAAVDGRGAVVVVTGEAGIDKTRLVEAPCQCHSSGGRQMESPVRMIDATLSTTREAIADPSRTLSRGIGQYPAKPDHSPCMTGEAGDQGRCAGQSEDGGVPSTGFEPAHTAPEVDVQ